MPRPGYIGNGQAARLLDVPEAFIPQLAAHGFFVITDDGISTVRLHALITKLPLMRLLGTPLTEAELSRLVKDPTPLAKPDATVCGVPLYKPWKVLAAAWTGRHEHGDTQTTLF